MAGGAGTGRLRNLGPKSTAWLRAIGIETREDLAGTGVVTAYNLLRNHGYNVSLNLLWALQGALINMDWRRLPDDMKADLRRRLEELR